VPVNIFDEYVIYEHQRDIQQLHRELEATRQTLDGTRAAWDIAQARLVEAQAALRETRAQLAPFQELGPIALGVARRLRRISNHSPRLASLAKWMIRRAHPRAQALQPDA
jgi:hypothetical protein